MIKLLRSDYDAVLYNFLLSSYYQSFPNIVVHKTMSRLI